jgi:hypothetical protein
MLDKVKVTIFGKVGMSSMLGESIYVCKAVVKQDEVKVAQRISDADLIALVFKAQEAIETDAAESIEPNLLLLDFARELLRKRMLVDKLIRR